MTAITRTTHTARNPLIVQSSLGYSGMFELLSDFPSILFGIRGDFFAPFAVGLRSRPSSTIGQIRPRTLRAMPRSIQARNLRPTEAVSRGVVPPPDRGEQ